MVASMYNKLLLAFAGLRRQEGQALVEYALIISLIAVVAIGVLTITGNNVQSILGSIEDAL
jgi:Flp pilus assembly pilin Flp